MTEETPQSGLSDNAAGALAYVTVIPAIIFLIVEPYNKNPYIKFHAWQSIFLGIAAFAISFINIIPILGQIDLPARHAAAFCGLDHCPAQGPARASATSCRLSATWLKSRPAPEGNANFT